MTLQQIEYFLAVAETGNFSHAAQKLYSSQPTLTRQIQLLEQELGGQLFIRNKRPMVLTDSGKIFYEGMKKAMDQIGYTKELTKAAMLGKYGSLSIGFLAGFHAEYLLLPVIKELQETCPTLEIQCIKLNTPDLIRGLQDDSLDIAFTLDNPSFNIEEIAKTELYRINTIIVSASDHPIASKNITDRDCFKGETIYLPSPMELFPLPQLLGQDYDLSDTKFVEVSSSENANIKVLTERGITISNNLDPSIQDSNHYHCSLLDTEYAHPYICAYTNTNKHNPVKNLFLELLSKTTTKLPQT